MKIDRTLQRDILSELRDAYPHGLYVSPLLAGKWAGRDDEVAANMLYLDEHGLMISHIKKSLGGTLILGGDPMITAKGIDFLENDGGLSAILATVTVKLHDETIRQLLVAGIQGSTLENKDELADMVQTAKTTVIEQVIGQAVQTGLGQMPALLQLLQNAL